MTGWWLSDLWAQQNGQVMVVSWLFWVILSITLHELAHGWTAIKLGDHTPIYAGHMTWNPLVHMGPYSLVMLFILGIAWGAMPVDPSRLRGKHADTLVTLAGPLMNLALVVVIMFALVFWLPLAEGQIVSAWTVQEPLKTNLEIFLYNGALLNFVLFFLNLLPIPPLDGGRILMNLWSPFNRMMRSENGQWIGLGLFILVLFVMGGAQILFMISGALVQVITEEVQSILFPSMG